MVNITVVGLKRNQARALERNFDRIVRFTFVPADRSDTRLPSGAEWVILSRSSNTAGRWPRTTNSPVAGWRSVPGVSFPYPAGRPRHRLAGADVACGFRGSHTLLFIPHNWGEIDRRKALVLSSPVIGFSRFFRSYLAPCMQSLWPFIEAVEWPFGLG